MKIKLLSSFLLLTIVAVAQKKNLTDNQMLRGDKIPNLLQPLPQVLGWLDDEQVLFSKKENGDTSTRYFIMNGKTGKVVPSSKDALQ
jgi:hypothetical protein